MGERLEMFEQIVAQIELNIARYADHHPARQELEDSFDENNRQQKSSVGDKLLMGYARIERVNRPPNDLREQDPDTVVQEHRECAPEVSPAVFLQIWIEWPKAL